MNTINIIYTNEYMNYFEQNEKQFKNKNIL